MIFSSLLFLFSFLPFVILGNYLWRNRSWQNVLLFIASLIFYAWGEKEKVFVMLASILLNYFIGRGIEGSISTKRKLYLTIGIVVNLLVLVYFKYAEFFVKNINVLLEGLNLNSVEGLKYEKLPIGISFYTFQSISYLIDVYRKEVKAQKNFIRLGLYIAFFPQLIAGPIVRYKEISYQLLNRRHKLLRFNSGIRRFLNGLGKKVLLANPIAYVVDEIYSLPPDQITFSMAWVAVIGYALQLYFDFSGYSDMAIGLGRMFGFKLPENFNFPYLSRSIKEFWTRWHITLSVWFRDYLYIPLGGNRGSYSKTLRNLLTVFFVTGLWHGASWSYVGWGLSHGFFIILEKVGFDKVLRKLPNFVQIFYTLLVLLLSFVVFRLEDWGNALIVHQTMLGFGVMESNYTLSMFMNPYNYILFIIGIIACGPILKVLKVNQKSKLFIWSSSIGYLIVFVLCLFELVNNTYNPFIYFRF